MFTLFIGNKSQEVKIRGRENLIASKPFLTVKSYPHGFNFRWMHTYTALCEPLRRLLWSPACPYKTARPNMEEVDRERKRAFSFSRCRSDGTLVMLTL